MAHWFPLFNITQRKKFPTNSWEPLVPRVWSRDPESHLTGFENRHLDYSIDSLPLKTRGSRMYFGLSKGQTRLGWADWFGRLALISSYVSMTLTKRPIYKWSWYSMTYRLQLSFISLMGCVPGPISLCSSIPGIYPLWSRPATAQKWESNKKLAQSIKIFKPYPRDFDTVIGRKGSVYLVVKSNAWT